MTRPSILISTIALMASLGCGGQESGTNARTGVSRAPTCMVEAASFDQGCTSASDAAAADSESEAGTFACGDARCDPSQICLTFYGCLAVSPSDAGICPDGTEYWDGSGRCMPPPPQPSCVSPAPGDGTFDCSGGDVAADCGNVSAPIPSQCGHFCRLNCA
jgi:hypothetical protein